MFTGGVGGCRCGAPDWLSMSGLSGAAPNVYRYFAQRYGPNVAAGIVGNTQQESGNNPGSAGGGLIQGQGGRTSSGSLGQQLAGVQRELEGPERGTLAALRAAKGPREAARIFSQRFERPGVPMLGNRERYAQEAAQQFAGLKGGSGGSGGSAGGVSASTTTSGDPAASAADLAALVEALRPQGTSTSVQGVSLPQPTGVPNVGARAPRELPQAESVAPSSLLSVLSKIGEDAPSATTTLSGAGGGSSGPASGGGYVNPLPGFTKGRTDQGVDYSAKPGAPIRALGDGKVLGISPNWYQGQPYLYYELTSGPEKGKVQFVAEQIVPKVKAGDRVRAGQTIATYAPSGTGVEVGKGTRTGGLVETPYNGRADGTETAGGIRERRLLEALGAR